MELYYSLEEKYIQAIEEVRYGETAKAVKLLNEMLAAEPAYARTYFLLGRINYYDMNDYQAAGYFFNKCIELEPGFPDVYTHYIKLLVFLKMDKTATQIAEKALHIPGVDAGLIFEQLGLLAEKNRNWALAIHNYTEGLLSVTSKSASENMEDAIERVKLKMIKQQKYNYSIHS